MGSETIQVNIKDVEIINVPVGAPLLAIFEAQRKLMLRYHSIEERTMGAAPALPAKQMVDLDSYALQARLKDMAFRCISEIVEATECLKNKPWKETPMTTDTSHFFEEISDAFHFFIEFCITAGLDAETLYQVYFAKHDVNRFRQRSRY